MKQALFIELREWRKPALDQWAAIFCLVIIAAAIAGAVPHAEGWLHKCWMVGLDLLLAAYIVTDLITGGRE